MGSAKSVPATPVRPPPVNKHLAHVSDPRSPSAGILRTPIQVESSPQRSPPAPVEAGETAGADQPRAADPRSPTPGISRTPMKTGAVEPTVLLGKQLGAELEAEAPEFSSTPKRAASSASGVAPEGPSPLAPGLGSGAESPPAPPLHRLSPAEGDGPPAPAGPAQASDKLPRGPETPRCAGTRRAGGWVYLWVHPDGLRDPPLALFLTQVPGAPSGKPPPKPWVAPPSPSSTTTTLPAPCPPAKASVPRARARTRASVPSGWGRGPGGPSTAQRRWRPRARRRAAAGSADWTRRTGSTAPSSITRRAGPSFPPLLSRRPLGGLLMGRPKVDGAGTESRDA
uniref:Cell division cycle associated 3 n=1 Tax=Ornithorhynchus anatinus TaxID=9258 RepID=A0A6I8NNA2_ORNAN